MDDHDAGHPVGRGHPDDPAGWAASRRRSRRTPTPKDADGTDGDDTDGTDGDGSDADGTDGTDSDGTDGTDTDGTDGDSSATA